MSGVQGHGDTPVGRLAGWFDVRLGAAKFVRSKLNYVFPEHYSFLFGEVALYSFVFLVATGIFLTLFYVPSETDVIYQGSYEPLVGVRVSEAYKSVVDLSFDVRAGLLIRQAHHWAALVFLGAIFAHVCRIFFTGAFRRPREINWIIGVTLLTVAMLEGFAGYSLLDDLLSGSGLRIAYSIVEGIPVVGTWMAFWIFGGAYPGSGFLGRLFTVHILLMPALITVLISIHLAIVARQHHTQFPGAGKREDNVVGSKLWPTYATMSLGLFFMLAGVLALMGGLLQINPVWLYGPYDEFVVTSGAQADWYVLWLQGGLRLMPGVSIPLGPYTIANQFIPGVLFPLVVFGLMYAWPFLEARVTGDHGVHHLLDRPRERPFRTAIGAAGLTGFAVLLLAGSDDVIAATADWSITTMRYVERVLLFVLPLVVAVVTAKVCRDRTAGEEQESELEAAMHAAEPRAGPAVAGSAGERRRRSRLGWLNRRRAGLLVVGLASALAALLGERIRNQH